MLGAIGLNIGVSYLDGVFQTIKDSDFSSYTIVGIKALAVAFFLVNILKKYNEGVAEREGYTWGLSPGELTKNFAIVLLVIFSTQILGFFDAVLVGIETQYRNTAPALVPLQLQDYPIEDDLGPLDLASKAWTLIYESFSTPYYFVELTAFTLGIFLWLLDLFIYPIFLAERFFLLGIMQAFFPLIISLSVFEKFRGMAYGFFKLYAGVYMLVPAFFLVNIFVNAIYAEFNANFWNNTLGISLDATPIKVLTEAATIGFILLLKFKLYKKAISFTLRLFTAT